MKSACGRRTARPEAVGLASQADVKLALKEPFESPTWPDALFSANNASTIWVIEALREMKIEMGIDVALVGFDDVDFYSLITPSCNGDSPARWLSVSRAAAKGKNRSIPLPPLNQKKLNIPSDASAARPSVLHSFCFFFIV
jgi:hypothetical protein